MLYHYEFNAFWIAFDSRVCVDVCVVFAFHITHRYLINSDALSHEIFIYFFKEKQNSIFDKIQYYWRGAMADAVILYIVVFSVFQKGTKI